MLKCRLMKCQVDKKKIINFRNGMNAENLQKFKYMADIH